MILWILMTILCSVTAVLIAIPLIRNYEKMGAQTQQTEIYNDQLAEVGRDLASNHINAA